MIQKLHLGTTLAALVLFCLPWIDIQCSNKSLATQTGIQTIYGGGSPAPEMEAFAKEQGKDKTRGKQGDDSMGYSPLVALALLAVIGAVAASFMAIRSDDGPRGNTAGILCAVALALLAVQMMVGFPAKKSIGKSMAESSEKENRGRPTGEPDFGLATAMMMDIQVRYLPALYIELIMLGLPALILANGLIDKLKKT
jgi:hypothetical protein